MGKQLKIRWKPQPRQLAFLDSLGLAQWFGGTNKTPTARLCAYGGAAGGGKSDAMMMAAIIVCLSFAKAQVGYFRRTYPELEGPGGSILRSQTLLADLVDAKVARYQTAQHRWIFANGSIIQFCHAQQESDVTRYQSLQFDAMFIDESTHFSEYMIHFLLTRNRLTVDLPAPIFACATNPGGEGMMWFKRLFIDAGPPETLNEAVLESASLTTFFVPAKLADNPALEKRDPHYRRTLEALPEQLRRQLLDGDWTSFEGQAFPDFNPMLHVVKPFKIPRWWKRWRCNDPGYTDPGPWYWMAADDTGEHVYIYREYSRNQGDPRIPYSEQAARVYSASIVGTEVPGEQPETEFDESLDSYGPVRERIEYTVSGMDAFNKHPETGKSVATYYQENGVDNLIEPVHGAGSRAAMKATWHEYLKIYPDPEGNPTSKVRIFSTCRRLIETLPLVTVDDHNPEAVADSAIDHWYQASGYGLQSHHAKKSVEPAKTPTRLERIWQHKSKLAKRITNQRRWG